MIVTLQGKSDEKVERLDLGSGDGTEATRKGSSFEDRRNLKSPIAFEVWTSKLTFRIGFQFHFEHKKKVAVLIEDFSCAFEISGFEKSRIA